MRVNPVSNWKSFVLGAALTLVLGVAAIVVVSDLRDRDASADCHGASSRMSLSSTPGGGYIATITVFDDRRREWELADEYYGDESVPIPVEESLGPEFHAIIRSVSDTDDGWEKVLEVRPVGEQRWCELKARIGLGF